MKISLFFNKKSITQEYITNFSRVLSVDTENDEKLKKKKVEK